MAIRLLFAFILLLPVLSAFAERDAIHYRNPDGTVTIYNAVLVTGLERVGEQWRLLALDYRGETGRFEGERIVRVEFGEDGRGRIFELSDGTATIRQYEAGTMVLEDGSRVLLDSIRSLKSLDTTAPSTEEAVAAVNAAFDAMTDGSGPQAVSVEETVVDEDVLGEESPESSIRLYVIVGAGVLLGLALLVKAIRG